MSTRNSQQASTPAAPVAAATTPGRVRGSIPAPAPPPPLSPSPPHRSPVPAPAPLSLSRSPAPPPLCCALSQSSAKRAFPADLFVTSSALASNRDLVTEMWPAASALTSGGSSSGLRLLASGGRLTAARRWMRSSTMLACPSSAAQTSAVRPTAPPRSVLMVALRSRSRLTHA